MNLEDFKKAKLPDGPGVYFFRKKDADGKEVTLYIGKATSLKDRVRSYFNDDLIKTRGRLLVDMMVMADSITYEETDSVLEAFIRESELIKQYQPKYNTKEKDNKSFNYVVITKEDFPRVLVVRGRNLEAAAGGLSKKEQEELLGFRYTDAFGPYPFGMELKEAMKLIRRIFPYRDKCMPYEGPAGTAGSVDEKGAHVVGRVDGKGKPCFNRSIGLCPGVCTGEVTREEYADSVNNIRLFFRGKKKELMTDLERQMNERARAHEFEKAGEAKKTLHALMHIQDISMIKKDSEFGTAGKRKGVRGAPAADGSAGEARSFRIEAYDIAHMSSTDMIGVMVVMEGGEFSKDQYKKFTIRTVKKADDTAALREVLLRRLNHPEWRLPHLMVIDGGQAQMNAAEKALKERGITSTALVSVVKDDRHKARDILYSDQFPKEKTMLQTIGTELASAEANPRAFFDDGDIISLNQECHRFAIAAHKKRRSLSRGL